MAAGEKGPRRALAPPGGRVGRDAGPAWDWLEASPRLTRGELWQLKEWYAAAYSDQRVPLVRLHNLIVQTERRLAQ